MAEILNENILIENKNTRGTTKTKKGFNVNLSESLSDISEASCDQNIAEALISEGYKFTEEALYDFLSEGVLSEENVLRITANTNNGLSIAEKKAAYALALEAHDPLMDKIRNIQAAKIILKEEVFKKYGTKAKMKLNILSETLKPSINKKIAKGTMETV